MHRLKYFLTVESKTELRGFQRGKLPEGERGMTLNRGELIYKWSLYSLAAALCLLVQGLFLRRITIWGVIPFLYPFLGVIPASFENSTSGVVFSLCMGTVCDWLLPGSFPCLYTLLFPLAGSVASFLSRRVLPAGLLCSLLVSSLVFALHGLFRCVLLLAAGHPAWEAGLWTAVREFVVTIPLVIPVSFLFQCVRERVRELEF
ncbi:MAG: hypothetical protein IJT94_10495 [Oscillibacter sp.]|nr:hypothetical protein [Oscillibacter sp.]